MEFKATIDCFLTFMLINFFKNFRQFFCSVLFCFFFWRIEDKNFIVRFSDLFTAWSEFYKKKFKQCSSEISVSNPWISQYIEIIEQFAAKNIASNVSIDLQIGQMMEEVKLRSSQFAFLLAFLLGWQSLGNFKQSPNPPDPNVKGHNSSCCSIV